MTRSENSGRILSASSRLENGTNDALVGSLPYERSWLSCHSLPVGVITANADNAPSIPQKSILVFMVTYYIIFWRRVNPGQEIYGIISSMRQLLQKLHTRIGDFWWYSLMLFVACRAADLLNAFVGLWLVPKYVNPSELGAVLPLTQFANFLAIPITAFACAFRNEVSRLAVSKEFGKLKTLMRGVFIAAAIFLFVAIVVARFTMPLLLERIRIVEGSLGIIIIATSFVGNILPIYANALQALKKFREQSIINVVSAPIRLIVMLITMPFRAITGYFAGQASVPAFNIAASVFSLRKEFSAKAEPYWSQETIRKFSVLFAIFLTSGASGSFCALVESTIIRQRLPDLDSAAYYMATRFSEIAGFLYCAIVFTIFPFTADLAARGKDIRPLLLKTTIATISFGAVVAMPFLFFGRAILSFLPNGDMYAAYWWAIPWMIGISTLSSIFGIYNMAKVSANSFSYMKWVISFQILYTALLLIVTGHGYFNGIIPSQWTKFLTFHNISSLDTMLWWMSASAVLHVAYCIADISIWGKNTKPLNKENRVF